MHHQQRVVFNAKGNGTGVKLEYCDIDIYLNKYI